MCGTKTYSKNCTNCARAHNTLDETAIRDLGYHVGYNHGKEDVENGVYGQREEFTTT